MGRSVITLHDATVTAYRTFEPDESYYRQGYDEYVEAGWLDPELDDFEDWMYSRWNDGDSATEWEGLVECILEGIKDMFPSMEECDEWPDREVHAIAQNAHSIVAVSEYNGVVAVSLAPNYDRNDYWRDDNALGEHWRQQVSEKFLTAFGEYRKIGTASNGEAFFERSN